MTDVKPKSAILMPDALTLIRPTRHFIAYPAIRLNRQLATHTLESIICHFCSRFSSVGNGVQSRRFRHAHFFFPANYDIQSAIELAESRYHDFLTRRWHWQPRPGNLLGSSSLHVKQFPHS
ncbi:hypothetical protein KCP71_01470 [Salmonella enterica subsp. enterica]|nr:hypothetical protein KCP71_01470 [Salmonella enterica subsp. enterica]